MRQLSAKTFLTPPEISLPMVTPPVSFFHMAALDHDVLARNGDAPAVGISAGLDRDAIVAGVEVAVLDQHVVARLLSGGNHHPAAPGAMAGRYRLLERVGAIRAVVSDGAESGNVEIAIRKNRRLDTPENLSQPFPQRLEIHAGHHLSWPAAQTFRTPGSQSCSGGQADS
jgi:hypothetical protein